MRPILLLLLATGVLTNECKIKNVKYGTVCVCDAEYCDEFEPMEKLPRGQFVMYTSNIAGERFVKRIGKFEDASDEEDDEDEEEVVVDRREKFQRIRGFGGAFTDATGLNINQLDNKTREHFVRSYYGDNGIEYNMGRVPIGGTDFSPRPYTYADDPEDATMSNFTLAEEDFIYKMPFIKQAVAVSKDRAELDLIGAAWGPPNWMKAQKNLLKEEHYQTFADYHIKFLEAYKANGIEFWGISTGNEPYSRNIFKPKPFLALPKNATVKWIRDYLGPTLRNSSFSELKLIGLDDNRYNLKMFEQILEDKQVRSYMDGVGIHWYFDRFTPVSIIDDFHDSFPELFIFGMEACAGVSPIEVNVALGSWNRGEAYAESILQDLQNWVSAWVDWNMALDVDGGPSYIYNAVDSPIIVNTTSGEFYKQPMYYTTGHFSKFLPRNSIRVHINERWNGLNMVAFERPDNGTAIIILNIREKAIPLRIEDAERGVMDFVISPRSVNSVLYY